MGIFGQTVGYKGLKLGTGSFLPRVYNFVFIKIFVGGRLYKNTKMWTNIVDITTHSNNKKNVTKQS